MDFAIFGTGRIGQVRARNLAALPGLRVRYLLDPVDTRAKIGDHLAMIRNCKVPLAPLRGGFEAQRLAEAAIVANGTGQPVAMTLGWHP